MSEIVNNLQNEQQDWIDDDGRSYGGWECTTDKQALWALDKIRSERAAADKLIEFYKAQIAKAKSAADNTESFFSAKLERYFDAMPHKETKTQSKYALPGGAELVLKKAGIDYSRDNETLLNWCRNADADLIKVTEQVKWADLKKRITIIDGACYDKLTGELISGCEPVETAERFMITYGKEV